MPGATTVKVTAGATSAKVYGRSFPETAAYTAAGLEAPGDENAHLTKFTFASGQAFLDAYLRNDGKAAAWLRRDSPADFANGRAKLTLR